MYRLSWESVRLNALWKYSNADPTFYKNTTQIVPNSQIPDEDWHPVSSGWRSTGVAARCGSRRTRPSMPRRPCGACAAPSGRAPDWKVSGDE